MKKYNSTSLTYFTATICKAIGIAPPAFADPAIDWVCEALTDISKEGFDRVVIHNADAVGMWLYERYPDAFTPVLKHTQITIPFLSPMPSVTPVCFGTMYTGAMPEKHGIRKYEQPVIQIDTFFDAATRAGRKVAIVSAPSASMSKIFLDKGADIYTCESETAIVAKAQQLILEDRYDILCVYTYMFDTMNHRHGPDAKETINALYDQGVFFDTIASCIERNWKQHNTLIAFAPDHGVHLAPEGTLNTKGKPIKGNHGSDSPLDLNILHYIGVIGREKQETDIVG